jgi:DNA-binding transcriptional MocR family regulator
MEVQSNSQSVTSGLKRTSAVSAGTLAAALGDWSTGADPLNEQLASAIAHAIELGDLPAGTRLPAERELAGALGLSRTTIVAAYDRLRIAGLVRSRQGSGTRVMTRRPGLSQAYLDDDAIDGGVGATFGMAAGTDRLGLGHGQPGVRAADRSSAAALEAVGLLVPEIEDAVKLTIGAMPAAPAVAAAVAAAVRDDLPDLLATEGYDPFGLPMLRERVAAHLQRLGVPTDPDQILVTSGAQQALDLIATRLAGPDAAVAIENPTYIGAIDAFRAAGTRLLSLPTDGDGARPELLGLLASGGPIRMAYIIPTFQNPTGSVMPEARRRDLVRRASQGGFQIIEDLTPDATLGRGTPPPLAALDPSGTVLTVGSLSKIAWGGLRVGWVRGSRSDIERLIAGKIVADHGTSVITQAVAAHVFDRLEEAADDSLRRASEQRELLLELLRDHLPDWEWTAPKGGLSLWVRLPGADAVAFSRLAGQYGVVVRPGNLASPDGGFRDHIRIAYGATPDRLIEGVLRLAQAWAAYRPVVERPRPALSFSV